MPFSVYAVISRDDGYTWTDRRRVYTANGHGKEAGAPQTANVGGTLVVSFMTNQDTPTPRLDGGQMRVVTSVDSGQTWSPDAIVTGMTGSHWAGIFAMDSTTFLALYSRDGMGAVSQLYGVSRSVASDNHGSINRELTAQHSVASGRPGS
jgi:hypothetical protein